MGELTRCGRGAEACYSLRAEAQVRNWSKLLMEEEKGKMGPAILRRDLSRAGLRRLRCAAGPLRLDSAPEGWILELSSTAAERAHVVGQPRAAVRRAGGGYFRLSAFNSRANVQGKAMERIAPKPLAVPSKGRSERESTPAAVVLSSAAVQLSTFEKQLPLPRRRA